MEASVINVYFRVVIGEPANRLRVNHYGTSRCGEFSEGLMCLSIEWKLYTSRNSNREQLKKIHPL